MTRIGPPYQSLSATSSASGLLDTDAHFDLPSVEGEYNECPSCCEALAEAGFVCESDCDCYLCHGELGDRD